MFFACFRMYSKEKLSTFDCGEEAAQWFSRNLLNKDTGFRLGYHTNAKLEQRSIKGFWESFSKIYTRMENYYFVSMITTNVEKLV